MSISHARKGLWGAAIALIPLSGSLAHEIVGNRFFPATLTVDDPGVNDELSLPTVDSFKTGDVPPVRQRDVSADFSKRITEDFAVSLGSTRPQPEPTGFRTWIPRSNTGSSGTPSMSSCCRPVSASNGAARVPRTSAPIRSTPTRR